VKGILKMKKQLWITLMAVALSASDAFSYMNEPRSSVYFGGQLGDVHASSKLNVLAYDGANTIGSETSNISSSSFTGGAHLGFGYRFPNCVYLGAEFRYNAFSTKAQKQNQTTLGAESGSITHQSRLQNLADFNLLIGGYICQGTLIYARLGAGFAAQQKLITSGSFGTMNLKKTLAGLSAGLGMKVDVGTRFYVGFDYTLNTLGKTSGNAANESGDVTHNITSKNQMNHMVLFSVGARLFSW
jgi:hypothetical protein